MEELLFKAKHSLIDQSLHSTLGAETTNGDGNGVGWYGGGDGPGRIPQHLPRVGRREPPAPRRPHRDPAVPRPRARQLRNGGPAEQLPSLPHGRWLFVHNGLVQRVPRRATGPDAGARRPVRRRNRRLGRLRDRVPPGARDGARRRPARSARVRSASSSRRCATKGSTPRSRPASASATARPVGGALLDRGEIAHPLPLAERRHDQAPAPRRRVLARLQEGDRIVVSEPLTELPGAWHELPEASTVTVMPGGEAHPGQFTPRAPERPF